jgi:hypothetical protein
MEHMPRRIRASRRSGFPRKEQSVFDDHELNHSEKTSSLLQPDSLIPYQYRDTVERKLHLQAEKRLMLAVLEDAIYCFQKYFKARRRKEQRIFLDTQTWILEPVNGWIFSFDNVCESLNLDAAYVRQGLVTWKQTMEGQARPDSEAAGKPRQKSHKTRLRFAA